MHNLDVRLLKVFLAVFETRSVGQAALRLQMSQPGLSTALGRLRTALGDPLFVRSARGMEPTARSRALAEPVRAILEAIESSLYARPEFEAATSTREFRLALSDIGEGIYLPLAIRSIGAGAPGVRLRSVSMPPRELEEAMAAGTVDLAAGYFPDIRTGEFLHRRVGLHSFACIMRSDHPLAGAKLTLRQFNALGHVVIEAAGRSQEVLEAFFRRRRIQRKVVLHTPHFMSVPEIVASTDLVAIVPQALADFITTRRGLTQVALPFVPPTFQVNIHWHRSVQDEPGNRWLRETLFSQIHRLQERGYDRNGRPARREKTGARTAA